MFKSNDVTEKVKMKNSWLAFVIIIYTAFFSTLDAREATISSFDFRATPLSDVFKVFTLQTGKNIVASPDVKDLEVTLYLTDVSPRLALETICKNYGLWYIEESNVVRVMHTEEFSRGLAFGRNEHLKYISLQYASCLSISDVVSSIYSERIRYTVPQEVESFNHIGTDGYPTIGDGGSFSSSSPSSSSANTSRQSSGANGRDIGGGVRATEDDIKRAINTLGTVDAESMVANQIGHADAFMTVSLRDNSIIIRSVDDELIEDISVLVNRLDTPTRQVLLEMKILEVSLGDEFSSFVDLSITPGTTIDAAGNAINSKSGLTGVNTVNQGALPSSSFNMGYVSDLFSYKMELFEAANRLKKIGTPLMLCANNASGKFFQGMETPLRKGYSVTTSKNSDGVITNEYVELEMSEEEIGISLEVSPSINDDKTVALKINAEISTVNLGEGPEIPYVIGGKVTMGQTDAVRKTLIQNIVVAKDGQNIALGGLIEEVDEEYEKRVPFLGDIPLIGFFFRSERVEKSRKEIVFLIRPHIIEAPSRSEEVTEEYFSEHSIHPYLTDSVETLFYHDKEVDVLVSTTGDTGDRTARLLEKNRDDDVDSVLGRTVYIDSDNRILESEIASFDNVSTDEFSIDTIDSVEIVDTVVSEDNEPVDSTSETGDKNATNRGVIEDTLEIKDLVVLDSEADSTGLGIFLNSWKRAWSNQNLEEYLSCYSDDFVGKGWDKTQWGIAKEYVFEKNSFLKINYLVLDVKKSNDLLVVELQQTYRSDEYCDVTRKILKLKKDNTSYNIFREDVDADSVEPITCETVKDLEKEMELN